MKIWFLSLTLLLFLAACDNSNFRRELGVIESDITVDEAVLSAPERAQVGVPFNITVRTIGGGCTEADGMESEVVGDLAVLRPYDVTLIPSGDVVCPAIVTRPEHTAQITFERAGSATIRVEGRSESGTDMTGGADYAQAVIEKIITVE